MNYNCVFNSIISHIRDLLGSQAFLDSHRFPKCFVRKRKLSMYQVIIYLLYTTKQKMETNIERLIDLGTPLSFPGDISKQAVSKARQGINPSLFKNMFDISVDTFYKSCTAGKLWRGMYRVFAIDGSRIQLPRSRSNFEKYGEMFSRKNEKKRWSMALASLIYDVSNDYICHSLILPYLSGERAAALEHCRALAGTGVFTDKSILIFDRGYYSEDMFRYFSSQKRLCVMRLREDIKIAKDCKGDSMFTLKGNPEHGTDDCRIRVIAVPLNDGVIEYLGTNIFDQSFTKEDFKELYFLRWNVEKKYDELKNRLLMEEFSGATSISVEQEFYINLLYANLASLVKSHADIAIDKKANPDNEYRYQANRSFIYGRLKVLLTPFLCKCSSGIDTINRLFESASRSKSQIQPDRSSPRNRIKTERTHFNNRKTAV